MIQPRILIAGIGNIFLGDDAFGVEVAQRLAQRDLPEEVRVVDFGIRSIDLIYALLDGYDTVILIDAAPRGGPPGTLYVIEPEPEEPMYGIDPAHLILETHGMDPAKVLRLAMVLGGRARRVLLVGCEPQPLDSEQDIPNGLSEPVCVAVEEAVRLIESLVPRLLSTSPESPLEQLTCNRRLPDDSRKARLRHDPPGHTRPL